MNKSETPSRPLSPHLQVYRLPMTALMSISHRITGVALSAGCLLITAMLVCAALGEAEYTMVMDMAGTLPGKIFLAAWSFALYYHLCNGVRHLIWDTVHMLEFRQAVTAGWVVIAASIALTALTWFLVAGNG